MIDLPDVRELVRLPFAAEEDDGGFSRGFAGHRQAQARMGLRLTPAQRLRWLETTMETLRRWRGRARAAQTSGTLDVKKRG